MQLTLKANWKGATFFTISNMQEMTSTICDAATTPNTSATALDWTGAHSGNTNYAPRTILIDTRDNNTYLVSKLADGNCWMSQNLALDLLTSKTLTSTDTDLNTKSSWTPENNTQSSEDMVWSAGETVSRSYKAASYHAYYRDGITKSSSPTSSDREYLWEKTGNHYNWKAATAGTGTMSLSNTTVEDSICPKGWRLPYGNTSNKSHYYLVTTIYNLSKDKITSTPFNYILAGAYAINRFQILYDETWGYMWSSTARPTSPDAYGLYVWTDGVDPLFNNDSGNYIKNGGFSIRCVSR